MAKKPQVAKFAVGAQVVWQAAEEQAYAVGVIQKIKGVNAVVKFNATQIDCDAYCNKVGEYPMELLEPAKAPAPKKPKAKKVKYVKVPIVTFDAMMAMPAAIKAAKKGVGPAAVTVIRPAAPLVKKPVALKISAAVAKKAKQVVAVAVKAKHVACAANKTEAAKRAWITIRAKRAAAQAAAAA